MDINKAVINNFKSPSGDLAEEQFILIYEYIYIYI